jgi:hypothetical protein
VVTGDHRYFKAIVHVRGIGIVEEVGVDHSLQKVIVITLISIESGYSVVKLIRNRV